MNCNTEYKSIPIWCDGTKPKKKISLTDAYNCPTQKNLILNVNDKSDRIF